MFGIGLPELIVIFGVALIPDKLPELAKSIAKGLHELKKTASSLKESLDSDSEQQKPWEHQATLPEKYPTSSSLAPDETDKEIDESKSVPSPPEEQSISEEDAGADEHKGEELEK